MREGTVTHSCFFPASWRITAAQSFEATPVATNTRREWRMARVLKSSAPATAPAEVAPSLPRWPSAAAAFFLALAPSRRLLCRRVAGLLSPFIMRLTVSTLGARLLRRRDLEMMYLCRAAYSRAEMV